MVTKLIKRFSQKFTRKDTCEVTNDIECLYSDRIQEVEKSHEVLMQLANDTAKLANEVGASLKDSTVKLIGGLSTSRAARLKELKVCQGDMTEVYSALNSSVDLICMTDVKGRLVFVNNKFAETYGYSIEELVGAPVSMVGTKIEDKETFELMWATILKSHVWSGTIHNRNRLTGKIVAVESSIVPIHASSNKSPTFFVCVQTVLERRKDDRQY